MHTCPKTKPRGCQLYFLPVATRVPLKFGGETTTHVTCARACVSMENGQGKTAIGWGETPLSVSWLWPSASASYQERHTALMDLSFAIANAVVALDEAGHPMDLGHTMMEQVLPPLLARFNRERQGEPVPWLAALACFSSFDLAMHDAYASGLGVGVYQIYDRAFMERDLSWYFGPDEGAAFANAYPADFLDLDPPAQIIAWHLVGGLDCLTPDEPCAAKPDDAYPTALTGWIKQDKLRCVKIKLRGTDAAWDYQRLVRVGTIALEQGVLWLSPDFNCMVTDSNYVTSLLDRVASEHPEVYARILYIEQPFPYDLEANRIDVRDVSLRKPLFMDESAHSWRQIKLGKQLGWTGVALKTCKTQTGALLSLAWARRHGMGIMVQDLTNPMLAQIPHVQLAARAKTIMGVESNSMQFYPDASSYEAAVHPGLYRRVDGCLDLSTLGPSGFGYRVDEIARPLPPPAYVAGYQ